MAASSLYITKPLVSKGFCKGIKFDKWSMENFRILLFGYEIFLHILWVIKIVGTFKDIFHPDTCQT